MTRTKRRPQNLSYRIVFFVGSLLLFVGVVGGIVRFVQSQQFVLARHIDTSVTTYADVLLNKNAANALEQMSQDADQLFSQVHESLGLPGRVVLSEWAQKRVFFALYDQQEFILAFPKQGRKGAKYFIESVALNEESVDSIQVNGRSFYSPAYSSFLMATDVNGYIVLASSKDVAQRIGNKQTTLSAWPLFTSVQKNVPRSSFAKIYISTKGHAEMIHTKYPEYKPLFEVVSESMPAGMISVRNQKEGVALHMNIHTKEGVFAETHKSRRPRQTLPALAQFAPKDVLFFMNGVDLGYKYAHTKQFLSEFHPQFALFFEGIVHAEAKQFFGDEFDAELDLLQHLGGQYATIVHGFPQTSISIISDVNSQDREIVLSQFHETVHRAQSKFSTRTVTIELPDGTTRQELVAIDPEEVEITTRDYQGVEYFVSQGVSAEQAFSYGIIDSYFILSSHEEGMKAIITAHVKSESSLKDNADFRESVLFHFSPSESYGFTNIAGWQEALVSLNALLGENTDPQYNQWASFFAGIRNASFARKVYEDQIITDVVLFPR